MSKAKGIPGPACLGPSAHSPTDRRRRRPPGSSLQHCIPCGVAGGGNGLPGKSKEKGAPKDTTLASVRTGWDGVFPWITQLFTVYRACLAFEIGH